MRRAVRQEFRAFGTVLGLFSPTLAVQAGKSRRCRSRVQGEAMTALSDEDIAGKIAARIAAKKSKNYTLRRSAPS